MPNNPYYNEIVDCFGKEILLENKQINRPKLANIIFTSEENRQKLNNITYTHVVKEIENQAKSKTEKLIIIDAPLLIEGDLDKICDIVISVIADENIKIKRICLRDNIDEKTAKARLSSQPSKEFYIKNSDYIIVNNNANLEKEAENLLDKLNWGKSICTKHGKN